MKKSPFKIVFAVPEDKYDKFPFQSFKNTQSANDTAESEKHKKQARAEVGKKLLGDGKIQQWVTKLPSLQGDIFVPSHSSCAIVFSYCVVGSRKFSTAHRVCQCCCHVCL